MNIHLPDPPSMNEATIGKHLKKKKDFGVFLGEKEGKVIIGIKN